MKFNSHSKPPLYKQIHDFIMKNIKNNNFKTGEKIPSERELCDQLKASRYSVRKAIQALVKEGFLYRVQGDGTYVYDDKSNHLDKKEKLIGVIVSNNNDDLGHRILAGIGEALKEEDYAMTYLSSNDNYKKEAQYILELKNKGVKGLIIVPAEDQKDSTAIADLSDEKIPFVLVDRRIQEILTDCVMSNNLDGGYQATEYLIELGHRKIGFIKNKYIFTSSVQDRILGYKKALREFGLSINSQNIFSYDYNMSREEINSKLYKFINKVNLTAVFCIHDLVAVDVFKMCRQYNVSIPEDLSIIGYDNRNICKHLEVPLTTIKQYLKEIGFNAAKLLIKKINFNNNKYANQSYLKNEDNLTKQIYHPVKLIKRDSCMQLDID